MPDEDIHKSLWSFCEWAKVLNAICLFPKPSCYCNKPKWTREGRKENIINDGVKG